MQGPLGDIGRLIVTNTLKSDLVIYVDMEIIKTKTLLQKTNVYKIY